MTMLDSLLGGGQKQDLDDFVNRYDEGAPWEGISDQEAIGRYQQVATQVSPDVFQQSAQDALSRLTPEQRAQFGQFLQQQAQSRGVTVPDFATSTQFSEDPGRLAQATTQLNQQQPGLLGELLGAMTGGGGLGGGGQAGGDLGGLLGGLGGRSSSPAGQSANTTGPGSILASPIAKAVLAGIAAMAVKQLSQRR